MPEEMKPEKTQDVNKADQDGGKAEPNPYEVPFDPPLKFPGQEVGKVVFREPTLADMRSANRRADTDLDREVVMISLITGLNEEDMDTMKAAQYRKLQDKYASFFE